MAKLKNTITIAEFIKHLEAFPKNAELYFGGLEFYRTKRRGDKYVQIEFTQSVYEDDNGKVIIEN